MQRPGTDEYHEFYQTYVGKVPDGDVLETLEESLQTTLDLLGNLPESKETYAYADGKWTIRELVCHMLDTERLFGFRALWMARGDQQGQPGMDQDDWNAASGAVDRPLAEMLEEFALVRRGHLAMFRGFREEDWARTGTASGFPFTVRSFPYIMAGHEIHHRGVLVDRYLGG